MDRNERRAIDVEVQKSTVVQLDRRKEAKFTLLNSSMNFGYAGCVIRIMDEQSWGPLHA